MGMKQMKCCCCPECTVRGLCCRCIPSTLCFTAEGAYEPESVELDYGSGENGWQGEVNVDGETIDLYLFYRRDDYGCRLLLRSEALGFGEGEEYVVDDGTYGDCRAALDSGVEGLTWAPVPKHKPTSCRGCKCLCHCICIQVTHSDGRVCTGRLCWDDEYGEGGNAWRGIIECTDAYGETVEHEAIVEWRPRGEFCESLAETDPYCDPYDDRCVPVLTIGGLGIENVPAERIDPCEERNVNYSWSIVTEDYEAIDVSITCSPCGGDCNPAELCCFQPGNAPQSLTLQMFDWWWRPPISETTILNPSLWMSACWPDGDRRTPGDPVWDSGCPANCNVPGPECGGSGTFNGGCGEIINDSLTLNWLPHRRYYFGRYLGAFRYTGAEEGGRLVIYKVPQIIEFIFRCDLGAEFNQYELLMTFKDAPGFRDPVPDHTLNWIIPDISSLGGYDSGGSMGMCDPVFLARFNNWPLDPCLGNAILITE